MQQQNQVLSKKRPRYLLHEAVQRDDKAAVLDLLNNPKTQINFRERKFGKTALWVAASRGHIDMVKLLLQQGADRNIADNTGKTPEDIATIMAGADVRGLEEKNPYPEIIRLLKAKQLDKEVDLLTEQFRGLGLFSKSETQTQPKPAEKSSTLDNSIKSPAAPKEEKTQSAWCVIS